MRRVMKRSSRLIGASLPPCRRRGPVLRRSGKVMRRSPPCWRVSQPALRNAHARGERRLTGPRRRHGSGDRLMTLLERSHRALDRRKSPNMVYGGGRPATTRRMATSSRRRRGTRRVVGDAEGDGPHRSPADPKGLRQWAPALRRRAAEESASWRRVLAPSARAPEEASHRDFNVTPGSAVFLRKTATR